MVSLFQGGSHRRPVPAQHFAARLRVAAHQLRGFLGQGDQLVDARQRDRLV
jgi:hypothetical protein